MTRDDLTPDAIHASPERARALDRTIAELKLGLQIGNRIFVTATGLADDVAAVFRAAGWTVEWNGVQLIFSHAGDPTRRGPSCDDMRECDAGNPSQDDS